MRSVAPRPDWIGPELICAKQNPVLAGNDSSDNAPSPSPLTLIGPITAIERSQPLAYVAYIGLGANLAHPNRQIEWALHALANRQDLRMISASTLYRSPPMGPADQPDYCNATCCVETNLTPRALLDTLLEMEREAGRTRGDERWGPRLLDLDLLHVVGVAISEAGLTIPHPGIALRAFVMRPLLDIAPELDIPGVGPIVDAAQRLGFEGVCRWY